MRERVLCASVDKSMRAAAALLPLSPRGSGSERDEPSAGDESAVATAAAASESELDGKRENMEAAADAGRADEATVRRPRRAAAIDVVSRRVPRAEENATRGSGERLKRAGADSELMLLANKRALKRSGASSDVL